MLMNDINRVYINGKIFSEDSSNINVTDACLMYGWGVFETIKVNCGKAIMLDKHIRRMIDSAMKININFSVQNIFNILSVSSTTQIIGIAEELNIADQFEMTEEDKLAYSARTIEAEVVRYIKEAGLINAVLRITLTKGNMDCPKIIFTHREILYKQDHYNKGFSAMISNFRRNASSPLVNIKSVNYLDNILAKQAAKEAGFDEAVMLNHEGYICEGSMSNLFFIKKNVLYTPSVNCGLIPGIVRGAIVDLFSEHTENNTGNNIENYNENGMLKLIEQGKYTLDQLLEADEAFLTNSVMGIMPLVAINNLLLGTGKPGAKTKEIRTKMNLI